MKTGNFLLKDSRKHDQGLQGERGAQGTRLFLQSFLRAAALKAGTGEDAGPGACGWGGCFHPILLAESKPSRVTWITE